MPVSSAPAAPASSFDGGMATAQPVDLSVPISYSSAPQDGHAAPTRPGSAAAVAVTPPKPEADVAPVTTYTIVKGDNLWSLAKRNGLTVSELAKANNLSASATLQPGKKLIIPGKHPSEAARAEVKNAVVAAAAADKTANGSGARPAAETVRHTVQPGESLGVIARKYQVTVGELALANNITDPSKVRAGQQLIIPGFKAVGSKSAPASKPAATSATPASPAATPATEAPAETPAAPRFEIKAPPPGQDLDSGLKNSDTEVPTIKIEDAPSEPKN
jgi:LysM repeat protein